VWPVLIVEASLRVVFAILLGAVLSCLGFGVQPPEADWGLMISNGRAFVDDAPLDLARPRPRHEPRRERHQPARRRPAPGAGPAPPGAGVSLLEVRGLTVRYAGDDRPVVAVRDVSFSLAPGRALGIVGESGSGKSSIAGAILDLLGPGADIGGRIVFEGRGLAGLAPGQRRATLGSRIGSVFQDPFTALNPALRVGRQIAGPLLQHRGASTLDAHRRAVELLAEMGITRRRRRVPSHTSSAAA
jgi:ABC-type multidrug transport system fused ATPase/permease subunit